MSGPEPGVPPAVAEYLAGQDAAVAPRVRQLDAILRRANPAFDVAVKYNLLMYAIGRDWRRWVCAIDAHPKSSVGLRFLYGVLMSDPQGVLRAGSSVLKTWDLPRDGGLDEAAVEAYVREAVGRYPYFREHEKEVLAEARARAAERAPARSRPGANGR